MHTQRPGYKFQKKCRDCGERILMIVTERGRLMPCDAVKLPADGHRRLIFDDGTSGRRHEFYASGFEYHPANCPNAKPKAKPTNNRERERLQHQKYARTDRRKKRIHARKRQRV